MFKWIKWLTRIPQAITKKAYHETRYENLQERLTSAKKTIIEKRLHCDDLEKHLSVVEKSRETMADDLAKVRRMLVAKTKSNEDGGRRIEVLKATISAYLQRDKTWKEKYEESISSLKIALSNETESKLEGQRRIEILRTTIRELRVRHLQFCKVLKTIQDTIESKSDV